jgi:hypothetical protein
MFFGYQIELEIVNENWLRKEKQGVGGLMARWPLWSTNVDPATGGQACEWNLLEKKEGEPWLEARMDEQKANPTTSSGQAEREQTADRDIFCLDSSKEPETRGNALYDQNLGF